MIGAFELAVLRESFSTGDVIDAETASRIIPAIRASGKNKGFGGPSDEKVGSLIFGKFPIAVFDQLPDRDYGNFTGFIAASTDSNRVEQYAKSPIKTPIYIVMTRRGTPSISDGGHRFMAAIARGDQYVPALMQPAVFEKFRSVIR